MSFDFQSQWTSWWKCYVKGGPGPRPGAWSSSAHWPRLMFLPGQPQSWKPHLHNVRGRPAAAGYWGRFRAFLILPSLWLQRAVLSGCSWQGRYRERDHRSAKTELASPPTGILPWPLPSGPTGCCSYILTIPRHSRTCLSVSSTRTKLHRPLGRAQETAFLIDASLHQGVRFEQTLSYALRTILLYSSLSIVYNVKSI